MDHSVFGKLKYKDEAWHGRALLPAFAAVGVRPQKEMSEAEEEQIAGDLTRALDGLKDRIRGAFGEAGAKILDAFEEEAAAMDQEPDPKAEAREQKRAERQAKRAARLARGLFPVRVVDLDEEGPSRQQEAAFRRLMEHADAVFKSVSEQVYESFKSAYAQEHWRKICGLKPAKSLANLSGQYAIRGVEIYREHHQGVSYLVFPVEADWEGDSGLLVVYHPSKPAAWATHDGLDDLIESDEPVGNDDCTPSPGAELIDAIMEGDDARAKKLIASGVDINALAAEEYPPLWTCVDQMDVNNVKRLLEYGADPNLKDPDEKTTPLKHAKALYRDMGFAPKKKKDKLLESVMELARGVAGSALEKTKANLEEIIRLLEEAGGK